MFGHQARFERRSLGVRWSFFGGGFDVHVSRSVSPGVNAGYNIMQNFSEPVGLRDNFNGPQVGISLGCVFCKGY